MEPAAHRLGSAAAGAQSLPQRKAHESSITVFRRHLKCSTLPGGKVCIDASAIHSREAYEDWLATRATQPTGNPENVFQRALSGHLTGADGRTNFDPNEEAAILAVLRRKMPWPCFKGTSFENKGSTGFRSWGFHEKARVMGTQDSAMAPNQRRKQPWSTLITQSASRDAALLQAFPESKRVNVQSSMIASNPVRALKQAAAQSEVKSSADAAASPCSNPGIISAPAAGSAASYPPLMNSPWQDVSTLLATPTVTKSVLEEWSGLPSRRRSSTFNPAEATFLQLPSALMEPVALPNLPPPPTLERALQRIAEYERKHPGYAVLALNTVAGPNLTELFIAQSYLSLRWIGAVARSHAGTARALVAADAIPELVRTFLMLAQGAIGVGGEVDISCRVELVDGSKPLLKLTLWQCDMCLVCAGARVL